MKTRRGEKTAIEGTGNSDAARGRSLATDELMQSPRLNPEHSETDSSDDEGQHRDGQSPKRQVAVTSASSLSPLPQKTSTGRAAQSYRKRRAPLQHHDIQGTKRHSPKRFRLEARATESNGDDTSTRPSPAVKVVIERADVSGGTDSYCSSIQNASLAITDITLHAVASSPELGFMTAVIRNARSISAICNSGPLNTLLVNILGDTHELENISMKPLVSGVALLTASIRNTVLPTTSAIYRPPAMQGEVRTSNIKRAASVKESQLRRSIPAFSRDNEISTDAESSSGSKEHSSDDSDPKPLNPTKRRP